MIQTIRSNQRYHFETDWLKTNWHFSFDHYHDPSNMSFGPLRVFNDDVVAPAGGFPLHAHREMEILTYVIEGALEHHDDMGNTGVIRPGEIQRMSAGTGVRHSEYNQSRKEPAHFIQLWIIPAVPHLKPSWEQKDFSKADRSGRLLPIAVPAASNGASTGHSAARSDGHSAAQAVAPAPNRAVQIHQDATIYTSLLAPGQTAVHQLGERRRAYIFVIGGNLKLNGETLGPGDQARVTGERQLHLSSATGAESSGKAGAATSAADFLLIGLP